MNKMNKANKLTVQTGATSLVLVNCSSVDDLVEDYANDEGSSYVPATFTGQFVDTYVKGLNYTCTGMLDGEENQLTGSGVTNDKGEFTCNEGNLVEFSIGSYVIGSDHAYNDPIKTPYDMGLGSTEAAINLAQLLQTIDSPEDGLITIPENFTALNGVSIKLDDPDFDALMADALNVGSLVDEAVAEAHLDETVGNSTTPVDTAALESFVSGKLISVEGELEATFDSNGSYSEVYQDEGNTGTCSGTWEVLNANTIETVCTKDGDTVSEYDKATWEFVGELKSGMSVVINTVYVDNAGPIHENFTVKITVSDI